MFVKINLMGLALQEAILNIDDTFCETENQKPQVGTTAACVFIDLKRHVLCCCNTGDARVLVRHGEGILFNTIDHKPSTDSEKQRLRENFGTSIAEDDGIARVNGKLAVSRAIGDMDFKIFGVLALP